jgi:hypothetical protein
MDTTNIKKQLIQSGSIVKSWFGGELEGEETEGEFFF